MPTRPTWSPASMLEGYIAWLAYLFSIFVLVQLEQADSVGWMKHVLQGLIPGRFPGEPARALAQRWAWG
jgi:hypothetical protein